MFLSGMQIWRDYDWILRGMSLVTSKDIYFAANETRLNRDRFR